MSEKDKKKLEALCESAGGEYARALLTFVTTDKSTTEIEMRYFISESTLQRIVKKYYESFPEWF